MKRKSMVALLMTFCWLYNKAQSPGQPFDSTVNNLILPVGYKTSQYGEIPHYIKSGKGKEKIVLIPGLGFDETVFSDFIAANKSNYTLYAITIPGYGKTQAPSLPAEGVSYGQQYWNKGVLQGILKLMDREKIEKAIIAGHSTQGTQLALRMAIDYPDRVSRVIILGGHAKFIAVIQGKPREFSPDTMAAYTDKYTAPRWFCHIRKKYFDDNNYMPSIYSLDSTKGNLLWKQAADVPLPVMVHYLCEFFASDIKTELYKIKCRVLVLRALFNDSVLTNPVNNYVRYQFIDAWNDASEKNPLIEVKDIRGAGVFVWKDKPEESYDLIRLFLKNPANK